MWFVDTHPGYSAKAVCEEASATLSEAEEEEIRERWDGIPPGGSQARDMSLETVEDAALDAVVRLKLALVQLAAA